MISRMNVSQFKSRKFPLALAALLMLALVPGSVLLANVSSQDMPGFPVLLMGSVTAGGNPVPDGMFVSLIFEDSGKEIGTVSVENGRYFFTINGKLDDDGKKINFYLMGVTKADQEETYIYSNAPRMAQTLDLTFPFIPEPTPTPSPPPTPTPTPAPLGPLKTSIQIAGSPSIGHGQNFDVDVVIVGEGHRVSGAEVVLSYDPRDLEIVDVATGSLLSRSFYNHSVGVAQVTIVIGTIGRVDAIFQEGSLVVVTFKIRNDSTSATTQMNLIRQSIFDHDDELFVLETTNVSDTVTVSIQGIVGDLNDDGRVNIVDLAILGASQGASVGSNGYNSRADLNEDGAIGLPDVVVLAAHYGRAS